MEVVIGTYEEFLVGYTLIKSKDKFIFKQSFTNHAHCGSVRSLATSNKYLASGSIDEVIHIINIKHRVETGALTSHSGTITALEFLRSAYLFSASEDGNICIWKTHKWTCDKILRGHKDAITSLSTHSSGKLLISVSKDKTLRTWNLIKGRCAYIINLKEIAHQVLWSPTCLFFAVVFDNRIDIYDISTGGIYHSIGKSHFDKRINKIVYINDENLIICGDCNELVFYNIKSESVINRFSAHENRIKDMVWVNLNTIGENLIDQEEIDSESKWLVTISSDGYIKVWLIDFLNLEKDPTLIVKVDSTCRPTCLAVWTSNQSVDKDEGFSIPELKISKEELEACKTKIKEKKQKRKILTEKEESTEPIEAEKPKETVVNKKPKSEEKPKIKPMKNKNKLVEENSPAKQSIIDDDEDDVEAIRAMKPTSKALQQTSKYKKGKKRNIMTFKMRLQQRKKKQEDKINHGGFKVQEMSTRANNRDRKPKGNRTNMKMNRQKFGSGAQSRTSSRFKK